MPPIGISRGYGATDPDDDQTVIVPAHAAEAAHGDAHGAGGHDHHAPFNPDAITPTESTFDDVYITTGNRPADTTPIGFLPPTDIINTLIPPPLAYKFDLLRAIIAGFVGTLVFTPIFYTLYFGYKDNCFDLGLALGAIVAPQLDWTTRIIGLGIHFGVGIGIAVTYALILYVLRSQSSGGRGTQFGILLCFGMMSFGLPMWVAIVSRWAIGSPQIDMPDMLLQQAGPANVGYAPLLVAIIAHMFYGGIVGHLYRHRVVVRQDEPSASPALA